MFFVNKENPHVFYFEEKMLTNEIKDGREAPLKPSFHKLPVRFRNEHSKSS